MFHSQTPGTGQFFQKLKNEIPGTSGFSEMENFK
jgi:hypothetical protein